MPEENNIALEQHKLFQRLGSIFTPYAQVHRELFFGGNPTEETSARFAHYTSAESALKIISTKRLWMRNTNCMSDASEVQHGYDSLQRYFGDNLRQTAFITALESCSSGVGAKAIDFFNMVATHIRFNTYVCAVSEHDQTEDTYGRLSMWRAFGGATGRVALIFKVPWLFNALQALNVYFTPVLYLSEDQINKMLDETVGRIKENREFLHTLDNAMVSTWVLTLFIAGMFSLKHEGFHEEREWRLVYNPWPPASVELSVEVVGGIPQLVHKIPLDATASENLNDLDLGRILERVIIGPTSYPWPMYQAFVEALKEAGVSEPDKKIFVSNIPIRT